MQKSDTPRMLSKTLISCLAGVVIAVPCFGGVALGRSKTLNPKPKTLNPKLKAPSVYTPTWTSSPLTDPYLGAHRGKTLAAYSLEFTHRPLSSSFLGVPYRILNINHKKELLRGLWVGPRDLGSRPRHFNTPETLLQVNPESYTRVLCRSGRGSS